MANEWERRKGEISAEDKKKISKEGLREMLAIYRFLLPYKWYFILGMLFLACSTMTGMSFPLLFGKLTGAATNEKDQSLATTLAPVMNYFHVSMLNALSIVLGCVVVIQGFFSFFRVWLFAQVSERTMADIRYAVYKRIISMPITFFESRMVGELNSRLSSDITQLQDVLSVTLAEFIRQILVLTMGIALMVFMSWKLTIFMLLTFPVLVVATLVFGRFIRKISKKAQDKLAEANVVVNETLQAVNIVKAFTNELREIKRYRSALNEGVANSLQAAMYRSIFVTFVICAIFGGIVLVVWYGSNMVQSGEIQFSDLLSFIFYTMFIGGSVGSLGDIYSQLQKTIGASERVRELLKEVPEIELDDTLAQNIEGERLEGRIRFEQVRFTYPSRPDMEILKGIDLQVNKGEKIGLVGHSGAGKSTITQLIMRFHQHSQGNIWIDGKKIEDYSLTHLRQNLGVVPQEVILFGGSIRENIAYGKLNATEEEIWDAARRANALEFIEQFPEKMDTIVGERGVKLSGGQRQRIAIARAILKNPAILILDEATSSLDAESESLVQAALNELMQGRTTLIIAHRLSTIRNADNIYVLDEGRIAESGNHEQLIQNEKGIYSHLVKLQFETATRT